MPTVTVSLVDRAGVATSIDNVINSFDYTWGSSNGFDQPQASILNISLYGNTINGTVVKPTDLIGQTIRLRVVENSIYTPDMTITSVRMTPIEATGTYNQMDITAFGPLFRMSKYITNRSVVASAAGTTWLTNIANDSVIQWGDINQAIQWNDYGDAIQWDDYSWNALDPNGSSTSGMYVWTDTRTWEASDGIPENAFTYIQGLAQVNDSWLCEAAGPGTQVTIAPMSFYAAASPSSQTLDCSTAVVFTGVEVSSDASQKVNDVTVANSTLTAYAADGNDIASWGNYAIEQTSTLTSVLELQNIAERILKSHTSGTTSLSQITVDLDVAALTLYFAPFLLTLTNLPTAYQDPAGTTFQVRGWSLRGDTSHVEADLVLVPETVWDYGQTMWLQTTNAWNTYLTALSTWNDVP